MTDKNLTDIILVLDQSPSMTAIRDATIEGVNALIYDQKKVPGDARFTLVKFDGLVHEAATSPMLAVQPLTKDTYRPGGGGTALYDAIGTTIDKVGRGYALLPEEKRPSKVIFVIYTDGEENSSHSYSQEKVKGMIERQKADYLWDFIFLGAELNAYQIGHSIGISNSLNVMRSAGSTASAYASTSTLLSNKRMASDALQAQNMSYSAGDIAIQKTFGAASQPSAIVLDKTGS
jgi:hypothetical protein